MNALISQIEIYIMVLVRVATIVMLMPFIGYRTIQLKVKIGFAAFLALIIIPLLPSTQMPNPTNFLMLFFFIVKEVATGLIIGFASNIIFISFVFAGTMVGLQMGFDMVQVLDPQSGGQVSLLGQYINIVAMLIFLAMNGHHFLIQAILHSFDLIPLTQVTIRHGLFDKIVAMSAEVFVLAIKIGIPAIATLLLTNMALGILARAVPQMNVFMVSFPLKIGIGMFTLMTFLPLFTYVFRKLMEIFQNDMMTIIKLLSA